MSAHAKLQVILPEGMSTIHERNLSFYERMVKIYEQTVKIYERRVRL